MGLTLNGNTVVVDHNSKDYLYTETYSNPSKFLVGNIDTFSVYRRKKSSGAERRKRKSKRIGDNCPLIYALKGIDDLNVEIESIKRLLQYMPKILDEIVQQLPKTFTEIVTIPSTYPLAKILAKRLALRMQIPILNNLLEKSTCFEATIRANAMLVSNRDSITRETEVDIRNTIKKIRRTANLPYSSKFTPVPIRKYFDPLKIKSKQYLFSQNNKVLLVDDLLASGETLVAADQQLQKLGLRTNCMAVTWFGKV